MKKSAIYIPIILAMTSCLLFYSSVEATNLVLNPGFEASASIPKNWNITGPISTMKPVTSIDSHIRFVGLFALKMESTNPNCHGRAVQIVEITGGQTYLFTARTRGGRS